MRSGYRSALADTFADLPAVIHQARNRGRPVTSMESLDFVKEFFDN